MTGQLAGSCKHCHTPVIRDPGGCWVHTSLRYPCTDQWGSILPTYADVTPVPPAAPVVVGRARPVGGPKR